MFMFSYVFSYKNLPLDEKGYIFYKQIIIEKKHSDF